MIDDYLNTRKNNIIFYREEILPLSETFINNQAKALQRHIPCFVGSRRLKDGINTEWANCILINNNQTLKGFCEEKFFKYSLRPPRPLVRTLKDLNPCLIHAHFAFDAVYALALAECLNVPLLVSLLGYDVTLHDEVWKNSPYFSCRMFPKRREKLLKSSRTHFIAISNDLKKVAVERGYPEEKINVHHIGVDVEKFKPSGEFCKEPTVLFVGRLVEKKGVSYLLQAMRKVQDVLPNARVTIIGDGPLRISLEEEARILGINANFMGACDNEFVKEQMNSARVVCVPSITSTTGDTEGLPIVVWEAMALGKAIVASYSAGIPEAIIHGQTGFISPEKDYASLADNILILLKSESISIEMGISARKLCEEKFSLQHQTSKLEKLYSFLCQRN